MYMVGRTRVFTPNPYLQVTGACVRARISTCLVAGAPVKLSNFEPPSRRHLWQLSRNQPVCSFCKFWYSAIPRWQPLSAGVTQPLLKRAMPPSEANGLDAQFGGPNARWLSQRLAWISAATSRMPKQSDCLAPGVGFKGVHASWGGTMSKCTSQRHQPPKHPVRPCRRLRKLR